MLFVLRQRSLVRLSEDVALLTDAVSRVQPTASWLWCRKARGDPLLPCDGDIIVFDVEKGRLDVEVDDAELEKRMSQWTAPKPNIPAASSPSTPRKSRRRLSALFTRLRPRRRMSGQCTPIRLIEAVSISSPATFLAFSTRWLKPWWWCVNCKCDQYSSDLARRCAYPQRRTATCGA